jgi:thiol-disulfide isomerase/thioredoxin
MATNTIYGQTGNIATGTDEAKIQKLIASVTANPDDPKPQEEYIHNMNVNSLALAAQYAAWMRQFPKSAVLPFELGKTYEDHNIPLSKEYLLKAVTINPALASAWEYLSFNASFINDNPSAIAYMERAIQAEPKNADYAYEYAFLHRDGDAAKYDSLMLSVACHFPESPRGAEALYQAARIPFNANEKTAYYETMYKMYAEQQPPWFGAGMRDYYDYLLNTSPDKAFDLALRLALKMKINRGEWKQKMAVARTFVEAGKLLEQHKPDEAAQVLKSASLGNSKTIGIKIDAEETFALFKAEAANANGKTKDAYDNLAAYYSKLPSDTLRRALLNYAAKFGIDSSKVDADIWKIRDSTAWKKTSFTLENLKNHKKVSLSEFHDKVVLLTYWYPGCGPCRNEFPHFEAVLKKFDTTQVAYLAINSYNTAENYVMPLIKNSGYTFIPLRDSTNYAKGNLPDVRFLPSNYLIDQNGRVIFSDFQIDEKNERTLELMITELLKTGKTDKIALKPNDQPQTIVTRSMNK